jgi:uncharacterized membrane protein HdeD (DUF308 family)
MAEIRWSTDYVSTYADTSTGRGVYIFFGIVLGLLGLIALSSLAFTSLLTTIFFGWLFFLGGIVEFFSIFFSSEGRSGRAALGILYGIIGLLILSNPAITLATLTLILAIGFTVGGLVRAIGSLFEDSSTKGWDVAAGLVALALGILIWVNWPGSSLYIMGSIAAASMRPRRA